MIIKYDTRVSYEKDDFLCIFSERKKARERINQLREAIEIIKSYVALGNLPKGHFAMRAMDKEIVVQRTLIKRLNKDVLSGFGMSSEMEGEVENKSEETVVVV